MTAPGDPPPPARRGLLRLCFEDRASGRIVVAQWPNLPMWIVLVGLAVRFLLRPAGRLGTVVLIVTALGLTWWALDELLRGSNPWRRFLGATVLAFEAYYAWSLLSR